MSDLESQRLDKWLWAARFFKTRKLASDAVTGGKIHVNGQRSKPGKDVKVGTKIRINKDQYTWEITVADINSQRRPAKEAVLLYQETPESHKKRQQQIATQREERTFVDSTQNMRPNKKQRRQIHRFKQS